ncbi:dnaJ protein P58IPK homolog B-like [Vespa mandarinia]|uniref:dnaJ protein P58IPK homolog B-like n=1 Tax=Vespa mandarinia TaxID=7446 RepID=UPI00161A0570|nr:dnaJ protein P58IPK homolog B-like [Vespa mandarinia]
MSEINNEYNTSIFNSVELQVNDILNPTLHEHSLLQSFVSIGVDDIDTKESNEEFKNVNKKIHTRHCLGKNEENDDIDNRESTDGGDTNKIKKTNKRFIRKTDTSFIQVQVQMHKSRIKQRNNVAQRQEEVYTDKDRAAAVNMGSKDIKQSLKQKKRLDRIKSPLLSDVAEPGSILELGKREMRLGNVNVAFNFINKALELSPNDINALIARSRCYLLLGNPQNALQDAETALQCKLKDSINARAVYYKAEALYYLGDFEMSLVYYYRGMRMRPEFGQFRLGVQKAKDAIRNILNHD